MKEIRQFKDIEYVIKYPDICNSLDKLPLIFYIHGAGTRGRDIQAIYNNDFFKETEPINLQAICVVPQCYSDSWFSIFEQLQEFVICISNQDNVDHDRIYVIGASMGGYATWQLAMSMPEVFAAIVPICGGGMYWNAGRLKDIGIWAFHGSEDTVVYKEESEKMVNAVCKAGGEALLTIYEGIGHDSWTQAFRNKELWKWLFAHSKSCKDI